LMLRWSSLVNRTQQTNVTPRLPAHFVVGQPGWLWLAVFVGTWFLVAFILERRTFRGAPGHIEYLY